MDALGWILVVALLGLFLYIIYEALFKKGKQTLEHLKERPTEFFVGLAALVGALMFLGFLASFGKLYFVIETPWIRIHSSILGLGLCLLPMFIKLR